MSQIVTAVSSASSKRLRESQPPLEITINNPISVVGTTSMSARFGETEWEARESQRQRELEEARARAAQMEKTMKWWSDCTANWREKWSKVRNERNKARDEAKHLRVSLEVAIKEACSYKREKNDLEIQIIQLKKEMEKIHMLLLKHAGQFNKGDGAEEAERDNRENNCSPDISSDGLKNVNSEDGLMMMKTERINDTKDLDIEEYILQGAVPKHIIDSVTDDAEGRRNSAEERRLIQQLSKDDFDEEYLLQKISMLQLRLDEVQKTVQVERDEKFALHTNLEKTMRELQEIKEKCEELRLAKQDAVRELLTLQEQHRAELRIINNTLQEETAARENLERRLCELRTELERLQTENAAEWGKRERLETEKLALERDNKKIRAEVRDLQERAERRGRPVTNSDAEIRSLQQELADKNKEIADIRHSHSKLKKLLAEANTELGHAVRRAEQYETEVKRLRARVEELKRELASAEDELDAACGHVRRLQRTNEELTGQTEGLQVQLQHLQTRYDFKRNFNQQQQQQQQQQQHQSSSHYYYDAKQSSVDDNLFDLKSRNYDFERAKQKFDNPSSVSSRNNTNNNKNHHNLNNMSTKQSFSKTNNVVVVGSGGGGGGCGGTVGNLKRPESLINSDQKSHHLVDDVRTINKESTYMNCNINLDGLKVSEDDDTS